MALRPIWDLPVCTSRCYHIITPLSTLLLRFCNKLFWGVIFQPLSNNVLPQKIRLRRISSSTATQGHSGWNKVALLTAVRNSPCSCPFSVSLHPPQAALNSKPRKRWSIIVRFISLHIKPALKGEVANVVSRRGYKAAYSSLFVTTPQSRLTPCQLPVRGAFTLPQSRLRLASSLDREPFGALYKLTY